MRSNQHVIDGPGGQIELVDLTKTYDKAPVLKGINLRIERGEFFSLLGPSGCGKTTTLRLIGGFEAADSGEVRIDGVDMSNVAPEKRPVNTVFQSYALFPHLSVADNVGFGLRFQKASKAEIRSRVGEALELVRLNSYGRRKAHQLSGGQQQRVALARALVLRPKVLLLDEPLGALDAKLRKTLQVELRALHRDVGITFVYVTHDQEEALTMSDRLAVMNEGEIEQIGTPKETYEEPASAYVADFLGVANLLPATVGSPGRVIINGAEHSADTVGCHRRLHGTDPTRASAAVAARQRSGRSRAGRRRAADLRRFGHPGPAASRRAQVAGADRQRWFTDVRRRGRDRRRVPASRRDPRAHVLRERSADSGEVAEPRVFTPPPWRARIRRMTSAANATAASVNASMIVARALSAGVAVARPPE